jgi:ribA/ribD-fused uncharacterized protein
MRLCIAGGCDFTDVEYAIPRIQKVHLADPVDTEICGMARGADLIGRAWAKELGIPVEEYHADWKRYGRAAGPIRNQRMADEGKPDCVLALPGNSGTASMVEIARKAGIKTIVYNYRYFSGMLDPVYGFLSNFYHAEIVDPDGVVYQTSEHFYQAAKTLDPKRRQEIIDADRPGKAKRLGGSKTLPLREDWETYKLVAMMDALRLKFPMTDSQLTDRLLHTGDDYLVEYAPWGPNGDTFWGVNKEYKGQNWLGRLLMRRRDEILSGKLYEPA